MERARLGRRKGLNAKGYISDPKTEAKSVVVTVENVQRRRELFEKHFGKKEQDAG